MSNKDKKRLAWFKAELNRLGIAAVETRNTEEGVFALRKLLDFFSDNYTNYLSVYVNTLQNPDPSDSARGTEDYRKEMLRELWTWANENDQQANEPRFVTILRRKVQTFDAEKVNCDLPFFVFVEKDLTQRTIHRQRAQKIEWKRGGVTHCFTKKEKQVIKYYQNQLDCVGENLTEEKLQLMADIFGCSTEQIRLTIDSFRFSAVLSLDKINYEDTEETQMDLIGIQDDGLVQLLRDNEDAVYVLMQKLNEIYDCSFNELHRMVFPPDLTNTLIMDNVKRYKKTNQNYDDAIAENWEMLDVPGDRETFIRPEYKCTSAWVFDEFERLRKRLTNAFLAAKLGISPSRFTKISEQAKGIAQEKLRQNHE